jgi:hypothetical protein
LTADIHLSVLNNSSDRMSISEHVQWVNWRWALYNDSVVGSIISSIAPHVVVGVVPHRRREPEAVVQGPHGPGLERCNG